ncbi:MAG: response regulator [Lachnospiraceae bacterium]|nr:response regulator [Lachnospiraceae bacterium]
MKKIMKEIFQIRKRYLIILGVATLMIIGFIAASGQVFQKSSSEKSDEVIWEMNAFYLKEISERRSAVLMKMLRERLNRMDSIVEVLSEKDMDDKAELRKEIKNIKKVNGLNLFAFVDDTGMVYTEEATFSSISRCSFLADEIIRPTITSIKSGNHRDMIILACPVENLTILGNQVTSCLCGIYTDSIIDLFSTTTGENRIYCNLMDQSGTFISSNKFSKYEDNLFDLLDKYGTLEEGTDADVIKSSMQKGDDGYFEFYAGKENYNMYYSKVAGTDWYMSVCVKGGTFDDEIDAIRNEITKYGQLQMKIILAGLILTAIIAQLTLAKLERKRYKQEKENEVEKEKIAMESKLLEEEREKFRYSRIVNALANKYHTVCYLYPDTDTAIPYVLSDESIRAFGLGEHRNFCFSEQKDRMIKKYVEISYRDSVKEVTDFDWLKENMEPEEVISRTYASYSAEGIRYAKITIACIENEESKVGYVVGLADADEEVRNEQEQKRKLEDALNVAEHANMAKTTFLNNMSHDIRTPMNAIIGFTNLAISHAEDSERVKDCLVKIETANNHLLALINDVLDMSRIESGKVQIENKPCELPEIIYSLRNILQADVKKKNINFFIDSMNVTHECVECDKLRLNQVLLNCAGNAIKFTEEGGDVCIRIIEKENAPDGFADFIFEVEDTGIGMSREFVKHIFEPFSREERSSVRFIQGTGLGMSIAKNIVDLMKGTISIESEPGKGTKISIQLRLKVCDDPKENMTYANLYGKRALVVDDSTEACINVCRILKNMGMEAEWSSRGDDALVRTKYAKDEGSAYDGYIVDWIMPDMNGLELIKKLRKEVGEEPPIVVLTAYDWTDIEREAVEAGATAFCPKPIFVSELYRVIQDIQTHNSKVEEDKDVIPAEFKGKRILLVDDVDLNREIAETILTEAGFEVYSVSDGMQAVNYMENEKPGFIDLVLMDIMMPQMNGYEATRAIRHLENEIIANTPIVAMTANAFEEDRKNAMEAGMNDHIAKPISIEKLFKVIQKFI